MHVPYIHTLLKGYTLDTSLQNVSDGTKNLYKKRSRSESVQVYCFAPDSDVIMYTVVWEKFVVGNIHEKKICGKKFHFSRLHIICNRTILCVLSHPALDEKIFTPNFSQTMLIVELFWCESDVFIPDKLDKLICKLHNKSITVKRSNITSLSQSKIIIQMPML